MLIIAATHNEHRGTVTDEWYLQEDCMATNRFRMLAAFKDWSRILHLLALAPVGWGTR